VKGGKTKGGKEPVNRGTMEPNRGGGFVFQGRGAEGGGGPREGVENGNHKTALPETGKGSIKPQVRGRGRRGGGGTLKEFFQQSAPGLGRTHRQTICHRIAPYEKGVRKNQKGGPFVTQNSTTTTCRRNST